MTRPALPFDPERVAALVASVAAEVIMPRFDNLERGEISEKKPGDLVTIADIEAERALEPELTALAPGSVVVGEEACAADPKLLGRRIAAERTWVVDPVDGTANFAAAIPIFAVMVAYLEHGRALAGWIHDPVKRHTAVALRGGGAWCDGKRIHVAPPDDPSAMSGAVGIKYGNRRLVRKIAGRSSLVGSVFNFRCAGHDYMALSSGRAHFALYHRLMPWDHAAGQLLHQEAGGYSARLDGTPYEPSLTEGGLLLAPDEASWRQLHAVLLE